MRSSRTSSQLAPHDEGEVELTVEHPLQEHLQQVGLEEPDLELWPLLPQCADDGGEHLHRDALERAHDEPPTVAGAELGQLVVGLAEVTEDRLGVLEQHPPGGCDLDRAGSTGAVEHGLADHPLEGADLLADGRLREAQALGRPPERALAGHGPQGDEVPDLDVPDEVVR